MSLHLIIVGAGQAAAQAIQTLRHEGFDGAITLLGSESHLPYQRPPLSKKYLAGELPRERLALRPESFYRDKHVSLELGTAVERLEPTASRIVLSGGRCLGYDRLLLATGSRVRPLQVPGADLEGVHYLRTMDDVDAIAAEFAPGRRLVLVGAGYIGLEVAAVAKRCGLDVTVLEAAERVMGRVVSPPVSEIYQRYHTNAGVDIHCRAAVAAFKGRKRVEAVETSNGTRHPCDFAIVGVGIVPNVELAAAAGLPCDDGILVDEYARTADPNIFAAGDCTNHPHPLLGYRVRLESVQNAIEQAKAAAASLMGASRPYDTVPWFWSDQYQLKLQIAGLSRGYDEIAIRGIPEEHSFSAFYLRRGCLIAVDSINSPRDFMFGKKLIAARFGTSAAVLMDPGTDLAALAKGVEQAAEG
ncbi:MAG TPA: FAD-dependent oxidoreductase [Gammaproteobacteria bacterium]|nr:FAD-dependent oxidoreductase [Gammaproteobacteria bacterium]